MEFLKGPFGSEALYRVMMPPLQKLPALTRLTLSVYRMQFEG
jgi:hypothetical protein